MFLLAACGSTTSIINPATPSTNPTGEITTGPYTPQSETSAAIPNFDHIILIVLENTGYSVAMNASSMPHFAGLAQKNVLLTNYYAISHPSLPNYLALISGSTQGLTSDCTDCYVNAPNLADALDQAGKTWKAYMESMPSPCFVGSDDSYVQRHDPFVYFDSIRLNASVCNRSVVPMTELSADLSANTLPNFSFIMPNLCNSGHDCSVSTADNWLSGMVSALQASPALGDNSLIVITFDEGKSSDGSTCCGLTRGGGHVATILISPKARSAFQDNTPYNHYSLLRTILAAWNLPALGNTAEPAIQSIEAPWSGN